MTRGELYFFKVTAWNVIGESLASEENSILAATVPLPPDRPTIAVQQSNTITIAWLEPDNGGSNIDDYQVKMCVGQSEICQFAVVASSTSGATQLSLSGLTQGTYYQFSVIAHNVIGYSDDSPVLQLVAADKPNQPDAPSNWIEQTSRTQIGVEW